MVYGIHGHRALSLGFFVNFFFIYLLGAIKVAEDVATPDIFLVRCGEWDAKNPDNTR